MRIVHVSWLFFLAGLVVAKLEVGAVPGDRCGGSKDGVRWKLQVNWGGVWMFWSGFGGVGERYGFGGPPPNASPLDNHVELFRSFRHGLVGWLVESSFLVALAFERSRSVNPLTNPIQPLVRATLKFTKQQPTQRSHNSPF